MVPGASPQASIGGAFGAFVEVAWRVGRIVGCGSGWDLAVGLGCESVSVEKRVSPLTLRSAPGSVDMFGWISRGVEEHLVYKGLLAKRCIFTTSRTTFILKN
jgi:hypothetical protein